MAFMSQERKKARMPALKAVLKKYGMKATFRVRNHSTLVATIKSGPIDFGDTTGVNVYRIGNRFEGVAEKFLNELKDAMYGDDYFDESDPMTDYFHCSHYIDINIGSWNKPYVLEA